MNHIKEFESLNYLPMPEVIDDYNRVISTLKGRQVIDFSLNDLSYLKSLVWVEGISMDTYFIDLSKYIAFSDEKDEDRRGIYIRCTKKSTKPYQGCFGNIKTTQRVNSFGYNINIAKLDDEYFFILLKVEVNYEGNDIKYFLADQELELENWLIKFKKWYLSDEVELPY